ncbi:hypothetical protein [Arachidicoccus sp.]|uniref:hypothetical protein n=1 Tax=Arachidicoccus sp. TaxID=1872624 RepID=UPI003D1FE408
MRYRIFSKFLIVVFLFSLGICSCKKDTSYYKDSGTINPVYNGNSLDYLKAKGYQFDSLVKIIHLAGLDDVIAHGAYTFFAPADSSIALSVQVLNANLKMTGKDTVSDLSQIDSSVWRQTLSMYIFDSVRKVVDYPQLDFNAIPSFHGQAYTCYGGVRIMNIGAIYDDAAGVKYAGYRHLVLSYIPSYSAPLINWINANVASSDILTSNGVIQALRYVGEKGVIVVGGSVITSTNSVYFGFDPYVFYLNVINTGIAPRE